MICAKQTGGLKEISASCCPNKNNSVFHVTEGDLTLYFLK